jgi:hypothetical protein
LQEAENPVSTGVERLRWNRMGQFLLPCEAVDGNCTMVKNIKITKIKSLYLVKIENKY